MDIGAVEGDGAAADRAKRGKMCGVDCNEAAEVKFLFLGLHPLVPYHDLDDHKVRNRLKELLADKQPEA